MKRNGSKKNKMEGKERVGGKGEKVGKKKWRCVVGRASNVIKGVLAFIKKY
ncbi:MAG: hypothetical protein V9G25_03930 [Acidimicrobiia bacterium]